MFERLVKIFLDFVPEFGAWIFGIQLRQLAQNFLGTLVARHGDCSLDFDDLISAFPFFGGRWNALLAQSKLLSGLGSGRNFQHGTAIDGRNLNFGAERSFGDGNGDSKMNVVAFAPENRVVSSADNHVEIPGRAAMRSGVAFAGNANALAVARARP